MVIDAAPVAGVTDQPPSANEQDNLTLETIFTEIQSIDEILNQWLAMQKESQEQAATLVADPILKEDWLEETIALTVENAFKAHSGALWGRFKEESVKNEKEMKKFLKETKKRATGLVYQQVPLMEKVAKEVAHRTTKTLEEILSSSVMEAFEAGVGEMNDKLEKSVIATLTAQVSQLIRNEFQTLWVEALKAPLESPLEIDVPALELSVKAIFERVDASLTLGGQI